MNDSERHELRDLRERAFGSAEGLRDDPAAQLRLQALEALLTTPHGAGVEQMGDPPSTGEAVTEPRARKLGARDLMVALATAVLCTLVGLGLATILSQQDTRPGAQGSKVGVLHPDPALPWPAQLSSDSSAPDGGVRFEDLNGSAVVTLTSTVSGREVVCLYVFSESAGPAVAGGCGAGTFAARAVVVVTPDMPSELLQRYQPGAVLDFELIDGVIEVRAER